MLFHKVVNKKATGNLLLKIFFLDISETLADRYIKLKNAHS